MTENIKINLTASNRTAEFIMTMDPAFEADRNMGICLRRDGACEPEIVHVMARVLREGDVAIDGGANVGYFTMIMSQFVGKTGLVFAVEPTPANYKKLEHNLANNGTHNVRVVKAPLYSNAQELTLHMGHDTGSNSVTRHAEAVGNMKVVSTTIDSITPFETFKEPRLIKLDIEGSEGKALTGAIQALAADPYVLCELNEPALQRSGWSVDLLREFMHTHNYQMFAIWGDGNLPMWIPPKTKFICKRLNTMALFASRYRIGEAWPEVEVP